MTATTGFLGLAASAPSTEPGTALWSVPDGWQQGRGAWGGLVTGALTRAAFDLASTASADGLRLRHLSAQLLAPTAPGPARLVARTLRRGSGTLTAQVSLLGAEAGADGRPSSGADPAAVLAQATVVLGRGRQAGTGTVVDGPGWRHVDPPDGVARPWPQAPVIDIGPPLAPVFSPHLEFRPLVGFPTAGDPAGLVEGWIRPRGPLVPTAPEPVVGTHLPPLSEADVDVYLAMIVDAWWPSVLVQLSAPRPVATVGFALDLPGELAADELAPASLLDPDTGGRAAVPLFLRCRPVAAREGYATEVRELWSPAGTLVAHNTQTMVVIR